MKSIIMGLSLLVVAMTSQSIYASDADGKALSVIQHYNPVNIFCGEKSSEVKLANIMQEENSFKNNFIRERRRKSFDYYFIEWKISKNSNNEIKVELIESGNMQKMNLRLSSTVKKVLLSKEVVPSEYRCALTYTH